MLADSECSTLLPDKSPVPFGSVDALAPGSPPPRTAPAAHNAASNSAAVAARNPPPRPTSIVNSPRQFTDPCRRRAGWLDGRPLDNPTAAYVAEALRHRARRTTRHAALVFQMGSAESGSTIKVRSAGRPQTGGQRMVVRAPPFDHPKVTRHNGRSMDRLPDVMVDDHKLTGSCFQDADGDLRDQARERPRPPARPAVQHMQLHRLDDRRQLQPPRMDAARGRASPTRR